MSICSKRFKRKNNKPRQKRTFHVDVHYNNESNTSGATDDADLSRFEDGTGEVSSREEKDSGAIDPWHCSVDKVFNQGHMEFDDTMKYYMYADSARRPMFRNSRSRYRKNMPEDFIIKVGWMYSSYVIRFIRQLRKLQLI